MRRIGGQSRADAPHVGAQRSPRRGASPRPLGHLHAGFTLMNSSSKWVPNHSHWGTFLAEVRDGRFVGVRPFPRDPDPSPLIEAMPAAVYSPTRIAQPMVREGFLA